MFIIAVLFLICFVITVLFHGLNWWLIPLIIIGVSPALYVVYDFLKKR